MQSYQEFININMIPLQFAYGLAYFSAGLAIALQRRRLSNFDLAHHLWLLGIFGMVHGASEWGELFIPYQSQFLSEGSIAILTEIQRQMWAISYIFLLVFGAWVLLSKSSLKPGVLRLLRWYAPAYGVAVIGIAIFIIPHEIEDNWIRYLLGFPGAGLTALAFLSERRSFASLQSGSARLNVTVTAAAFGVYALLSGLTVPNNGATPIAWLNSDNVHKYTSMPVEFWRLILGVGIAFFVIRTLSIFDQEMRSRLEVAETERALLEERQRIARDLHDGVVQSIYAAGLQLEVASKTVQLDMDEASLLIRRVVNQLNDVIADIRRYIFKLGPDRADEADFTQYMQNLIDELTATVPLSAELSVVGEPEALSPGQRQNIAFAARECLSNVIRHARAGNVQLKFVFDTDSLFFVVEDDGIGIDLHNIEPGSNGHHRGLKSMAERAEAMKGEFSISQKSVDGGTIVAMRIPYTGRK